MMTVRNFEGMSMSQAVQEALGGGAALRSYRRLESGVSPLHSARSDKPSKQTTHRGWLQTPSSLRLEGGAPPSEALSGLSDDPLSEQAAFWTSLAESLAPFVYSDPQTEWDAVARYFDGTTRGVRFIFDKQVERRKAVDKDLLYTMLNANFGFMGGADKEAAMQREAFLAFCDLVLSVSEHESMRYSFEIALRLLRIGSLLSQPRLKARWLVYVYDYDDNVITGSFAPSTRKQSRFKGDRWVDDLVVAPQVPCGQPGSGFGSIDEFLVSDPWVRNGQVRWVHAVRPCLECLLALGQQYHLRVHAQCLLSRLTGAQPQVEVSKECRDWSSVVFPAAYVERSSKKSFDRYQAWYYQTANEAKVSGYFGKRLDREKKLAMPGMKLGIVQMNLMVMWSRKEDSTVLSVASEPKYIAKWSIPDSRQGHGWWNVLTSWCRRRDGYQRVPTGDDEESLEAFEEEDELDDDDQVQKMFKQFELTAEAEDTTHFEDTFEGVLLQLSEPNSVLRMGSHTQLVFRILLNRSADYVQIMQMYTVAISHMKELLNSNEHRDKDQIIKQVSAAKRELQTLCRMVQPFVETILPQLSAANIEPESPELVGLQERACRHYKLNMETNFRQFLQECTREQKLCESLLADYDRHSQDKVNSVLNFLAIITFLIMPTQILTGLYGMNFKNMPELRWGYGYHWFFSLSVSLTVVFAFILFCLFRSNSER